MQIAVQSVAKRVIWNMVMSLAVLVVLTGCFGDGLPNESNAKAVFENKNKNWIDKGFIHINSLKKTNGQKEAAFGQEAYTMDFEAVVSFPKGTNPPCLTWGRESKDSATFYMCFMSDAENISPSGQPVKVVGKIQFEKTEKGWRSGDQVF